MIFINKKIQPENGSIIVSILIVTLFLSSLAASMIVYASSNLSRGRARVLTLEAQYAAESGADAAIGYLNSDPAASYTGSGGEVQIMKNSLYKATFSTTVVAGSSGNEKIITTTGKVYAPANSPTASYTRRIEVITQRTSDTVGVTGILSRNIIDLQSGVKNVFAKDLYVNGYINTNKNTTNIVAENVTVGGKNTGATNCSIGGPGNLVKPASFITPGQTKLPLARSNPHLYLGRSIWIAHILVPAVATIGQTARRRGKSHRYSTARKPTTQITAVMSAPLAALPATLTWAAPSTTLPTMSI
jgi:hypothetical protein